MLEGLKGLLVRGRRRAQGASPPSAEAPAGPESARILLYCHNVFGLGHIMRSFRIAEALSRRNDCECAIVTGCRFLDQLEVPAGAHLFNLPPVIPNASGYLTRREGGSRLLRQRSKMILDFARRWAPHAFLVDHNPLGLGEEVVRTLRAVTRERWPTSLVWGVRDIWVTPEQEEQRLGRELLKHRSALSFYQSVIVYSDRDWIDTLASYRQYGLPPRQEYVGIVTRPILPPVDDGGPPRITGLSGGGTAAKALCSKLLRATAGPRQAGEARLRFVCGPFSSQDPFFQEVSRSEPNVEIWGEGSVERAVQDAAFIVARVGYNTAYTVVQTDLPVVLVPLRGEGEEQTYRASLLAKLPGVWSLDESSVEVEAQLAEYLRAGLKLGRIARTLPFRLDGAERAASWLLQVAREAKAVD